MLLFEGSAQTNLTTDRRQKDTMRNYWLAPKITTGGLTPNAARPKFDAAYEAIGTTRPEGSGSALPERPAQIGEQVATKAFQPPFRSRRSLHFTHASATAARLAEKEAERDALYHGEEVGKNGDFSRKPKHD